MNYLEVRNAESRALWLLRYLSGAQCSDPFEGGERMWFEYRHAQKLTQAREWLANREIRRMPSNVVLLRRTAT